MSVRFILGRAGSGKTHACLEAINRELQRTPLGPMLILLVPEQASFQYERRLLEKAGARGTARAAVLSFHRLAQRVFHDLGAPPFPLLGPMGRRMLIRSALLNLKERLTLFERAAGRPGFTERMAASITELKNYGHTPEVLLREYETLRERGQGDSILGRKIHDLALIFEEYEKLIAGRFTDPDDTLALLARKLESWDKLRRAKIWVDGFAGFTPREIEILRVLSAGAGEVSIALCLDPDELPAPEDITAARPGSAFMPTLKTFDALNAILNRASTSVPDPIILAPETPPRFRESPPLAHLERAFSAFPPPTFNGKPEHIKIISAQDRRAEVLEAASEIVRLVRDHGLRFRRVGVILRSIEPYRELIREIFTAFNIPHFIDFKPPVTHHPLIELARSLMEIAITDWAPEPVFRALKTDLVPGNRDLIDTLENYVLAHGLRGKAWTMKEPWNFRFHYLRGEDTEPDEKELARVEEIDQQRRRVADFIAPFVDKVRKSGGGPAPSVATYAQALWETVERLGVRETLNRWAGSGGADITEAMREHVQVCKNLAGMLDEMVSVMGADPMPLEDFRVILESGLEALSLSLIPPSLDTVLVSSIERSRNPELDASLILGGNEREFPSAPNPDPIFNDEERERMQKDKIELGPPSRVKAFHENFLAYIALTRSSRLLWISYHQADDGGREQSSSSIPDRVREIFPGLKTVAGIQGGADKNVWAEFPNINEFSLAVAQGLGAAFRSGSPLEPDLVEAYNTALGCPKLFASLDPVIAALDYRNQPPALEPELARELFGPKGFTASVSRLEAFAACPFMHFAKHGLGLRLRAGTNLEPSEFGILVHSVLEAIYRDKECRDHALPQTPELRLELMNRVLDKILPEVRDEIFLTDARYRAMAQTLRRVLGLAVETLARHEHLGGFRVVEPEISFGFKNSPLPALAVELEDGTRVLLRGKIDRLEAVEDAEKKALWVRVIDYKTYNARLKLDMLDQGLALQLVVYLAAALNGGENLLGLRPLPAGAFYFPVVDSLSDMDDTDPEAILEARMKKLKLFGVMARDLDLVRLMDSEFKKYSILIPAILKSEGAEFAGNSYSTISLEALLGLCEMARDRAKMSARGIYSGEIGVKPYKIKNSATPCSRCDFRELCRFDTWVRDNEYRDLKLKTREQILEQATERAKGIV